ncbi:MAG: hypothetical protein QX189_15190 [Methylococcales bacterium]
MKNDVRFYKMKNYSLHALFFGVFFGLLGWFLINYGFLNTKPINLSIEATGNKSSTSKSAEVWFYGAYKISDGKKIPTSQLIIPSSWEERGESYVSYANQPSELKIVNINEILQLTFGSHPYSGVIRIKWDGNVETIDLYSSKTEAKTVTINPRYSQSYPLILFTFVCFGFFIAIPASLSIGRKVYYGVFAAWLIFSIYITLATFYPGVYSADSVDQLNQALTNRYYDWHPPLMAWFWSILISMTGLIGSLMIFHLLLLAAGAIYWARILERLGYGIFAFIIPIVLASPVIVNFSGVIWKDVGLAYALLSASGIAGLAILNNRINPHNVLAIMLLLIYAVGVRVNGVFAIIPIVIFVVWIMLAKAKLVLSRLTALVVVSIAVIAVLIVGMNFFVYNVLKSQRGYTIQAVELYDIAGITHLSKQDYFPEYLRHLDGYNISKISEEYEKSIDVDAGNLIFPAADGTPPQLPVNTDAELQSQLRKSWLEAITSEPVAYLKHRLSVFRSFMERGVPWYELPENEETRSYTLRAILISPLKIKFENIYFPSKNAANEFVQDSLLWSQGAFIYKGWFWLGLLLTEMILGMTIFKKPLGKIVVMTSFSGLLYLLAYIIIAPGSGYRYLYWSTIAGTFTALLLSAYAIDKCTANFSLNKYLNHYTSLGLAMAGLGRKSLLERPFGLYK